MGEGLGNLTPTGEKTSPLREARHFVFIKLTLSLAKRVCSRALHAPLARLPEWETQNLIMILYFSEMV